jgi:hypothetical protein
MSASAAHRKVLSKASRSAAFRRKLLKSPHKALADMGFDVPKGRRVKVFQNTDKVTHIVLPAKPKVKGRTGRPRGPGQVGMSFTFV